MNFEIIIGRTKTGKSTYMRKKALKKMKSKENIIYIVPEHMTYSTEMELIQQSGEKGFLKLNVSNFKKLEKSVLEEVGGNRKEAINDYGKIMLIKQICEANKDDLKFYANSIRKEGFLREINELIKDIKKSKQEISSIEEIIPKLDNSRLTQKLQDISYIYNRVEEEYGENYYDSEDKTNLFIEKIKYSDKIKNTHFIFDGFESLVGQRLSIVEEIIKYSKSATFALCIDSDVISNGSLESDYEAFEITNNTYLELMKIAKRLEINPNIVFMEHSYIKYEEIRFLEKNFFDDNSESYLGKCNNVSIMPSDNTYEEVKNVAIEINNLIRTQGYRYKDIAVVTGSVGNYSLTIKNTFNQFDIPIFIDEKKAVLNNPFIKYILLTLDMLIYNFKQQTVLDFFKTGYYDINYYELDKLENFVLEYGIEGYRWFKPFTTESRDNEICEMQRIKFSGDYDKIRKKFNKLTNAKDITLFIYEIMDKQKIPDKINDKIDRFRSTDNIELSNLNAQIWNSAIDILEQIIMTSDDTEIKTAEYKKIVEAGFREIRLSIIPPAIDKITFGELDRATSKSFKAVFLIGANESVLIQNSNDNGLLMDREILSLKDYGIKLINSLDYNDSKHKHILYKLMSSPSEKLYISYSCLGVDEKVIESSRYVDKIYEIIPSLKPEFFNEGMDRISNPSGTYEYLIKNINNYSKGKSLSNEWVYVYKWYEKNQIEKIELLKDGINYTNKVDALDEDLVKKLYLDNENISVSKLENYAKCNFKYFMQYGLKAVKRKELKVEFYNIGNVFHNSVQLFTDGIINDDLDIKTADEEDVMNYMLACVDEVLEKNSEDKRVLDYNSRNGFVKNKIKRLLSRTAVVIVDQIKNSEFKPDATEFKISEKIKSKYFNNISFNGIIDRIDVYEENGKMYINIIDYKSSKKDLDLSNAVDGYQLQLLAYLSVLLKNSEYKGDLDKKIGGVFYFNIDDPYVELDNNDEKEAHDKIFSEFKLSGYLVKDAKIAKKMDNNLNENIFSDIIPVKFKKSGDFSAFSKVLEENNYENLLSLVEDNIESLTAGIIRGEISIEPIKDADKIPCTYCDYKSICQFDSLMPGNEYKIIKSYDKEEIEEILD